MNECNPVVVTKGHRQLVSYLHNALLRDAELHLDAKVLLLHDDFDFLSVSCMAAWKTGLRPVRLSDAYIASLQSGTTPVSSCTDGAVFVLHHGAAVDVLALFEGIHAIDLRSLEEPTDVGIDTAAAVSRSLSLSTWTLENGEPHMSSLDYQLRERQDIYPLLCLLPLEGQKLT